MAYASLIATGWAISTLFAADGRESLESKLARGDIELRRSEDSLAQLRSELAEARKTIDMRRAALDRPDWSALLRTIGSVASPDVSLREMKLDASVAASAVPGQSAPRLSLSLSGTAPSQLQASQFTVRLQKLGLFDAVDLVRSGRDLTGAGAVSFDVTCVAPDEEVRR